MHSSIEVTSRRPAPGVIGSALPFAGGALSARMSVASRSRWHISLAARIGELFRRPTISKPALPVLLEEANQSLGALRGTLDAGVLTPRAGEVDVAVWLELEQRVDRMNALLRMAIEDLASDQAPAPGSVRSYRIGAEEKTMVQLVERHIIHAGEREYELVPNWGELPSGWHWGQCAGVAIDSEDNVHVYTRTDHPYMVFDKSGKFIDSWGENDFGMAHSLWINPDDSVYVLSHKDHWIRKFDKHRKPVLELGKKGVASDTNYTREQRAPGSPWLSGNGMPTYNGVGKSAGPFNEPTSIAQADNGFIFLSDGYKNARVHKFSADGQLVKSWGEPGNAMENRNTKDNPNHFHTPHGIGTYGDRVFVCDREHNRIQVFTQDGDFIEIWTMMERPTDMHISKDGIVYISELEDHVSIRDVQGNEIGRFGSERSHEPGKFWGPHSIWVDSEDNMYVGEVLEGQRVQKFARRK